MTTTTFFIIFIPILAILLLAVNLILAPHNPYQEKDSAFECGFHSFLGQNRKEFHITFFIFGMVFLIFDLEIVLIFPYSVSAYHNDIYGLVIMMIFFVLLTLGFVFELGKNALTIYSKQSSSYVNKSLNENHTYMLQKSVIYNKLTFLQANSSTQKNIIPRDLQSSIIPRWFYNFPSLNRVINSLTGQITYINTIINNLFDHRSKIAHLSSFAQLKTLAIIYIFIYILIFLLDLVSNISKPILDVDFSGGICLLVHIHIILTVKYAIPILCSCISTKIPEILYFISTPLQSSSSGSNGDKTHLLVEKDKINSKIYDAKYDIVSTNNDLKEAKRTNELFNLVPDSKNNALNNLKGKYKDFFDEESGNTPKEGITFIIEHLDDELRSQKRILRNLFVKKEKVMRKLKEFEDTNSLLIFVIRPLYSFVYLPSLMSYIGTYFSLLMTIFSLVLTVLCVFTNLHLDTPYFIHNIVDCIQSIIKYEIFISLPLFIWSFYSLIKRYKKYLDISRRIIDFINTSQYIDVWVLLLIFFIQLFF